MCDNRMNVLKMTILGFSLHIRKFWKSLTPSLQEEENKKLNKLKINEFS